MLPVSLFDLTDPHLIKRSQTLPPGKAFAQPLNSDRPPSAPLPLSLREQQVCECFSQCMSFEAIAKRLGLSPLAAKAYYRRALAKRQQTTASLEPNDRKLTAQPEQAVAELTCDRPASAPAYVCNRSPFDSPAVEAPALLERPNAIDLCVSSLYVFL